MLTIQSVGNLVNDPKLVTLKDDFKIVESRIAVTKSKDRSAFIDVKFKNNKAGEIFLQYAKQGSGVSVWGELDEETWGEGENKRSKWVIVADGFRFTGGQKSDDKPAAKTQVPKKSVQDSTEDIPF